MMVLITYDVNTTSADGQRRLRQVAKTCENYGQRVQNSVFECLLDPQQLKELHIKLKRMIEPETDSLRFYRLGANWKGKVEHVGAKQRYDPEGFLMI
ncbi:CRISPR-associated endonuclease Cas2 [Brevibacillus agri]|uniref:CRISPR-associated endonuclease Cas2 n=1 Tax=Brevibacillus agri TaxID=51101 RepID=UPI0024C0CEC4|nr:CRISPR-associated endonuclease Cas2 [Brevibacillus agri]WHX29085.1 CRISPR-associated endonuclease Cas2 [Brevibacillus agri]